VQADTMHLEGGAFFFFQQGTDQLYPAKTRLLKLETFLSACIRMAGSSAAPRGPQRDPRAQAGENERAAQTSLAEAEMGQSEGFALLEQPRPDRGPACGP